MSSYSPKKTLTKFHKTSGQEVKQHSHPLSHPSDYFSDIINEYYRHKEEIRPKNTSLVKIIMEQKKIINKQRVNDGVMKLEDSLDEVLKDDKTKKSVNKLTFKNNIYERNSPKTPKYIKNKKKSLSILTRQASESYLPKLETTRLDRKNSEFFAMKNLDKAINFYPEMRKSVSKLFVDIAKNMGYTQRKIDAKALETHINHDYKETLRNTILNKETSTLLKTIEKQNKCKGIINKIETIERMDSFNKIYKEKVKIFDKHKTTHDIIRKKINNFFTIKD